MSQSFFRFEKAWYDGELWVIHEKSESAENARAMAFCSSELLPIYDGGDFLIVAVNNAAFYMHGTMPYQFEGFLGTQI